MNQGADVTAVLGWGLRRYAWLIALFVVSLGVIIPGLIGPHVEEYQAKAQVGPVRPLRLTNIDVLPKLATDVFDYVLTDPEVKEAAGVKGSEPVGPGMLTMSAGQDNIVFSVVGRQNDPVAAANLANVAASRFVEELNIYSQSVGTFSLGHLAETPSHPLPTMSESLTWAIGVASGLLVGCGVVALLLVLRRPVIDVVTAEHVSGATVLGRITLDRGGSGASGMTHLCHRIVSQPTRMVLMAGPRNMRRERHELADELVFWLSRVRQVISIGAREPMEEFGAASLADRTTHDDQIVIVTDASPVDVATRPDRTLTLLVVREGIARSALQEQAGQYVDGGSVAMVLVRRGTWLEHLRNRGPAGRPPLLSFRSSHRSRTAKPAQL